VSTPAQAKELDWFPCYPDRLLASGKWLTMKDFQRGWYWHLLVLMTRSKPLGYLPLDGQLWMLAGAHTKQYWEHHSGLVLACFKVCEFDGQRWIYSEPLMKVLNEQTYKRDIRQKQGRLGGLSKQTRSKSSLIYSLEFKRIWEESIWKCVGKSVAYKAFQKALIVIQEEKKFNEDAALEFLAEAIEAFKISPAGRDHGLFDGYSAPHPASWLNAQRYFDDRRTWRPGAANVAGKTGVGASGAPAKASTIDPKCPTCQGLGFTLAAGKASPCACRKRNAANGSAERCGDERQSADASGAGRDFKSAGANDR